MRKLNFTKMVASGNDFVVIKDRLQTTGRRLKTLAVELCDRKYGAGADGMLLLEKSKKADVRMRIFNADGSEAEMCGNGARCIARFVVRRPYSVVRKKILKIQTKAGIIEAEVKADDVKIKLTDPAGMKLGIPLKVRGRTLRANFINTGVPHAVIFVEGLEKIDVAGLGRQIRFHEVFAPKGANVNFVEVADNYSINVRTYERGVEDETLACGTGSVASALLTAYSLKLGAGKVNVHTKGGEVLKVYFDRAGNDFRNVWLEGKAKIVYSGEYHV